MFTIQGDDQMIAFVDIKVDKNTKRITDFGFIKEKEQIFNDIE